MNDMKDYDWEWRKSARFVPADFKGLLAFRQFKMTMTGDVYVIPRPDIHMGPFEDDFTLRSIFQRENWRPTGNVAHCNAVMISHAVPSRDCTCGYYGSYSSSIIYQPDKLKDPLYCFAAVRMYGENLPLAQNGLRAGGADISGILFHPTGREVPEVQSLMRRLSREDIFYTFSAREFIKRFPDQSYKDILGFDPVERQASLGHKFPEGRGPNRSPDYWLRLNYSHKFCRPVRPEMLLRRELPDESTESTVVYEVYLKPEYRPGGSLYKHPLLEIWDN